MLAYVFWHFPAATVSGAEYEERLAAFHRSLAVAPPEGFRRSAAFAVPGAPWLGAPAGYEDWYLVADFAALGRLNDAAVSAPHQLLHDAAARYADGGTAGIYKLASGPGDFRAVRWAVWLKKPPGVAYPAFFGLLAPHIDQAEANLWQRQMTLGPATEFCLQSSAGLELPAELAPQMLELRRVA